MTLYEQKTWDAITPLYEFQWLKTIFIDQETMNSIKMFILFNDNRLKYIL